MSRFKTWMDRMGFNGKQITAAGDAIGIKSYTTLRTRVMGKDELTKTELLAMAALRAGLAPWSEEVDPQLVKARRLIEVASGDS